MPALPVQAVSPVTPQAAVAGSSQTLVGPLLNSLVQTLASLASTSPISKPSPPAISSTQAQTPPQATPTSGGGLSAAAAASLLNTLIMAQNVLTNTSTGGVVSVPGGGAASVGDTVSVLSSMGLEAVTRGEQ